MRCSSVVLLALTSLCAALPSSDGSKTNTVVIANNNPHIHFNGRWDKSPGTWWTGSGFKSNVRDLSSMTLHLGPHTTQPNTTAAVSVDFGPFYAVNVSEGANQIPLESSSSGKETQGRNTIVRVNMPDWQDNRMNLESIELNSGAKLLPYTPQKLAFQFIGDSLSAGQFLPLGVDQAWTFLTGEAFKAEHNIQAQPGITLTDMFSYGNDRGMDYLFFRTEDDGFYYSTDHNYTTPWNFARDQPAPTHIIIHIGTNDSGQNVTVANFTQTYLDFLAHVREVYPTQPFFVFSSWGWPNSDGSISPVYPGVWENVVHTRNQMGDHNTFLVNTTGWVSFEDVFPDNQHPTIPGHQKIAGLFGDWLRDWGLQPEAQWRASFT